MFPVILAVSVQALIVIGIAVTIKIETLKCSLARTKCSLARTEVLLQVQKAKLNP